MPRYTAGERLRSRVSSAEVIVVRGSDLELEITCAGTPLARNGEPLGERPPAENDGGATLLGKRYEDEASGIELLCVVAGEGQLAAGERPLTVKAPKPLPASD